MAITVNPMVSKSGVLTFVATNSTPATSGLYPLEAITAKGGDATVQVNGTSVSLGSAAVELTRLTWAALAYQLQCGSVSLISMSRGALTSYTAPTATADSTSVSKGLVISNSVLPMMSGVLSYTITNGGSGYPPGFFAYVAGGSFTSQASVLVISTGGVVTSIVPYTGSWTGHGVGYTGSFSGTLNLTPQTPGSGCTFTATVGNYVAYVPVTSGGSGLTTLPHDHDHRFGISGTGA